MEIVVATTIFAFVVTSMMTLMDYTLKINRRAEALRQATQGMRNLVEFIVKEIRNGQIDYNVENGNAIVASVCPEPIGPSGIGNRTYDFDNNGRENRLGIVNYKGERSCVYLVNENRQYKLRNEYGNVGKYIMYQKESMAVAEELNPENFSVTELKFFIRPDTDPYSDLGGGVHARVQPSVTMAMKFVVELPTKEKVEILYQTSVSTNKYDLPK
jgi:hypothetical protein